MDNDDDLYTPCEAVRKLAAYYAKTGLVRPADLRAALGDPCGSSSFWYEQEDKDGQES
jgi:hypothetical protein